MMKDASVVIIGGGISGCGIAYYLAKKGVDVVVCEKNYLGSGATGSCGAGIRQQWSTKENAELAIKSVKIFENLSDELGIDIEFIQGGYLIINHSEEDEVQAKKNVAMQKALGLDVSLVDTREILSIAPVLDIKGMHAVSATFCPSDGHANPFVTTFAYANAARNYGASILTHTTVIGIDVKNNRISKVHTNKGNINTSVVVNAAGVWSKDIVSMVDIDIPNVAFRKEVLVTERLKPVFQTMVISFRDGIYFSQQPEGNIVGGIPIPEERSGFYTMPTFDFLRHMSQTLTRYVPALKYINMLRHWTGFYDVTPDARPILGEDPTLSGFFHCHGFSGHGFMLAPMVCKLIADSITDQRRSIVLDRLSIDRFKDGTIEFESSVVG
jgi:sarcosine oxidase subunit beta